MGQGSPGGFQIHSPGAVWFQRLGEPSSVIAGLAKALSERASGNTTVKMTMRVRISAVTELIFE
jgi:hypothetical protein